VAQHGLALSLLLGPVLCGGGGACAGCQQVRVGDGCQAVAGAHTRARAHASTQLSHPHTPDTRTHLPAYRLLPPTSLPVRPSTALEAPSASAKLTNPKQRDLPLSSCRKQGHTWRARVVRGCMCAGRARSCARARQWVHTCSAPQRGASARPRAAPPQHAAGSAAHSPA
jgi:hypothetical protein